MSKPKKLENTRADQIVDSLYQKIQRRTITESSKIGYETILCMRSIISHCTSVRYGYYIKLFRRIATRLQSAQPLEFIISNVIRRILYQFRKFAQEIREKHAQNPLSASTLNQSLSASSIQDPLGQWGEGALEASTILRYPEPKRAMTSYMTSSTTGGAGEGAGPNMSPPVPAVIPAASPVGQMNSKLFNDSELVKEDFSMLKSERDILKSNLCEYIDKILISDIKCFSGEIKSSRDSEQVHPTETVMVYGGSNTVREYLINRSINLANKGGCFEVYVAEAAPCYNGHRMAADLAYGGLKTTLIPDTAISALMPRVNKVIVGVHAIMVDGGLVGQAGLHAVALAAKAHSVPLVVVSSTFKITPIFPTNKDFLASMDSPSVLFPIEKSKLLLFFVLFLNYYF